VRSARGELGGTVPGPEVVPMDKEGRFGMGGGDWGLGLFHLSGLSGLNETHDCAVFGVRFPTDLTSPGPCSLPRPG
jgi:hypothetical protein